MVCDKVSKRYSEEAHLSDQDRIIWQFGMEFIVRWSEETLESLLPEALIRNLFNQFTSDWSRLLFHYAARTFLACDPVVDVALDQGFLTNAAPQSKVHGLIMRLTQWYCCGHSNGSGTSWPRWTRGDSISPTQETWVICESVTPN